MELKIISIGKFSRSCPYEKIFYHYMKRITNKIILEEIKVIISTNIKASELYKDGLQRDQFLPFIDIIEKNSMRTMAWVGKTEDLSGLEPDSEDWISDSKLPETVKRIFKIMMMIMLRFRSNMWLNLPFQKLLIEMIMRFLIMIFLQIVRII